MKKEEKKNKTLCPLVLGLLVVWPPLAMVLTSDPCSPRGAVLPPSSQHLVSYLPSAPAATTTTKNATYII